MHDRTPYDSIASRYDELFGDDNPYYGRVSDCERELFMKWVPVATGHLTALDVGSGTGLHSAWLASRGYRVLGIDISREMVRIAVQKSSQSHPRTHFQIMNALDETPIEGEPFAVISCLGSSLNHIPDWNRLADLVSRRLAERGVFIFSYDNLTGIDTLARTLLHVFEGYSTRYIRDIALPRLKAILGRTAFQNHWRVVAGSMTMEVGLTYESTARWKGYLHNAGLEVQALSGVHVFNSFKRELLRASAGILPSYGDTQFDNQPELRPLVDKLDHALARACHQIAANVVGVAVKR